MLADLVNSGCVEDGSSDGANNPLSQFTKSVFDHGRQRDLGGGSSSQMDAALPAGPGPSSAGLLPEMGPSEAEFLHAFEHNTMMQREWVAAAAAAHQQLGPPLMPPQLHRSVTAPPQLQHAAAFADAWAAAGGGPPPPSMLGPGMPDPMAMMHRHLPPHHPALFAGAGPQMMMAPPMPARARSMMAMPPPPKQLVSGPNGVVDLSQPPPSGALSAEAVNRFDAQHEDAWASLAATRPAAPPPQVNGASVHLPRGDSNTYLAGLLEAQHAEAMASELAPAGPPPPPPQEAAERDITDSALSSAYQEMEKVWQQLSVQERQAISRAQGGVSATEQAWNDAAEDSTQYRGLDGGMGAADFDEVWQSLRGQDYEASWDDLWAQSQGLNDSLDAAHQLSDAEAPYTFHENNPYIGQSNLLEKGTELFRRGELKEAVLVLEAAVQADNDNTIAWQTLGQTHADADDDGRAIACLRRAVAADPHNLDALLALGVSYTNELDQTRALSHLQLWLESNPEFTDLGINTLDATATGSSSSSSAVGASGTAAAKARMMMGGHGHNPFEL